MLFFNVFPMHGLITDSCGSVSNSRGSVDWTGLSSSEPAFESRWHTCESMMLSGRASGQNCSRTAKESIFIHVHV